MSNVWPELEQPLIHKALQLKRDNGSASIGTVGNCVNRKLTT